MNAKRLLSFALTLSVTVGCLAGCTDDSDDTIVQENLYNSETVTETGFEWSNVTIVGGGYIPGMVYNETEEGLVYVKTDIGGAYRKKKGEDEWTCITDCFGSEDDNSNDWNYNCIESIATDPIEPSRVYMSCGTSYGGDGCIMYSYDYGDHWTKVDFDFSMGGNDYGRNCGERLMIDPNDNSRIYYGSHSKGMFVSNDYGQTWENLESFPTVGSYHDGSYSYGILWITCDKTSSDEGEYTNLIFCGVAEASGEKVYYSDDAGETWNTLLNEETDNDEHYSYFPCQGKVSADGNLYVTYSSEVTQENNPSKGKVFKYNIADGTWTNITPFTGETGHGYCGIAVYKDEMVAVTTICHWASEDNILVTKDGGETWVGLWNKDEDGNTTKDYNLDISDSEWLDWQGGLKLGWWTSGVAINPFNPDELLYGTGATLYGTDNLTKIGEENINISVVAEGIEETAILGLYSPKDCGEDTPALYSILGDLYGFRHDDVDTAPEEHWGVYSFKADDLAVAGNDPNVVVRTTKEMDQGSICYSLDGSKTWQFAKTPDGVSATAGGEAVLSADGGTLIYSPDDGSVTSYVTNDWGETWSEVQGLGSNTTIIADEVNPDKFYATYSNGIYMSTDKGKTFELIISTMVSNMTLVANKEIEGDLWVSLASGPLYHIENADVGAELVVAEGDIDYTYAVSVGAAENEGDYGAIYIYGSVDGKGNGVYQSTDMGKTWVKMNNENERWGNVNKTTLEADPKVYGRVYLSTNGRGILMSDVASDD